MVIEDGWKLTELKEEVIILKTHGRLELCRIKVQGWKVQFVYTLSVMLSDS